MPSHLEGKSGYMADSGESAPEEDENSSDSAGDGNADEENQDYDPVDPSFQKIVTVKIENRDGDNPSTGSVTFGQVFREGDVSEGRNLVAASGNRSRDAQIDVKAVWPDGSLKHAIVSMDIGDLNTEAERTISLGVQDDSVTDSAPAVSLSDVLSTAFDADLEIVRGGQSYSLSARSMLQAAKNNGGCDAWGESCKQWLSGPEVSEWIVGGPMMSSTGEDSHLAGYFHVRAYADGGTIDNVRVDTVIENNWAYSPTSQNATYDATIQVGDHSYAIDDLEHYRQARWHKVLWWRDRAEVYARHDVDYLQDTKAISKYADLEPTDDFLDGVRQDIEPMTNGDQTAYMPQTGAQAAIGPLPQWTSTYVVSGDARAFNWMRANDDALGAYGFHYRDAETGRPLRITDHPWVTIANYHYASRSGRHEYRRDLLAGCPSDCDSPYEYDISHHPSTAYVSYLVTGDYYYLEEMQFAASYIQLWANQRYRKYGKGILRNAQSQVRGQAWSLRSISDAAWATPDADPMKVYFVDQVETIIDDYNTHFVDQPEKHPLHVIDNYGAVIYSGRGGSRVGIGPWQADFFAWSVGHAAEQGFAGADKLLDWLAPFQIGRMTNWKSDADGNYCWIMASAYTLQIRPARNADFYDTLDEAYAASFPRQHGLDCDSQAMANSLSNSKRSYQIGEMSGYADSATGFPSNLQIGLAMAAGSDVEGGEKAWQIFAGRPVQPDYDNNANFAVVPR